MKTTKEEKLAITTVVKRAHLHQATMVDQKTETTLSKTKVPSITSMGWNKGETMLIVEGKETYLIPAAAVQSSVLE